MGLRAAAFDRYAKEFLEDHPDGTVIHLGCGLDSRFLRVDNGRIRWFDLDLPSVIGIKSKLFEETGRYTLISSSVTDFAWIDRVSAQVRGPVFIIAEGLLMYLGEPQVKELFLRLRDSFKPCAFVFDAYSRFSAKCAKYQSSLKQTGAVIRWGTDSPEEIERFGSGISHVKTEYYPDWDLTALSGYHRFMFAFMGRFKTAREAHRVFMFRLS
jgi:O-methyltransferase involved in polyketide biosynthesis